VELAASVEKSDLTAEIAWRNITPALRPVVRAWPTTRCGRLVG